MKNEISNRHRGNLGGRFTDVRVPAKIRIALSRETADTSVGQHLTWMLLNLLARQAAEIQEIELDIPKSITPTDFLSPLITKNNDFIECLEEGLSKINPTILKPNKDARSTIFIRVGPGDLQEADFSVVTSAKDWNGYVGLEATTEIGTGKNPIGAYVAASLCAGEVFKYVRTMRDGSGTFAKKLWFDAYRLKINRKPVNTPKTNSKIILPPTVLAGVGAVANGFLQSLYSFPNVYGEMTAIDGDEEGITETNLNRYTLFGLPHIETINLKASTVSQMFEHTNIKIQSYDCTWHEWRSLNLNEPLHYVISAVDKNSARHAIQDALPKIILGASTNDMRAQVNLYDVFNHGSCLKCRNKVEELIPDDEIVEKLKLFPPDILEAEAHRMNINFDDLKEFLFDPKANCGKIAGSALQKFIGNSPETAWSVGFVSFLAGILLAAEYLKTISDKQQQVLSAGKNLFRFQFWHPENKRTNTIIHFPPDNTCICQSDYFQSALNTISKSKN